MCLIIHEQGQPKDAQRPCRCGGQCKKIETPLNQDSKKQPAKAKLKQGENEL
jgi:hypothetical protein